MNKLYIKSVVTTKTRHPWIQTSRLLVAFTNTIQGSRIVDSAITIRYVALSFTTPPPTPIKVILIIIIMKKTSSNANWPLALTFSYVGTPYCYQYDCRY